MEFTPSSVRQLPQFSNSLLMSAPGAFLAGLVVPREGNLAIVLTEKLEDMVAIIFLPLVSLEHELTLL